MKYLEFAKAANLITNFYLNIKSGENVVLVRDTRVDEFPGAEALLEAVAAAASLKGAEVQIVNYVSRPIAGMEPPRSIAAAMKAADVAILMTTLSILQTVGVTEAIATGTRLLMLPPARYIFNSLDMLYRLMPEDSKEIEGRIRLAEKLVMLFQAGTEVRVTSGKGTDITLSIGKLKIYHNPTTAREPGQRTIVPGGQVTVGVTEGQAEGKFVVDGSASPMYRPLRNPIEIVVTEGKATAISGHSDAREYREFLESLADPQVYAIAEIGVGFHPRAKLSGTPLEDERIFGASWIALGTNVHLGGTVKAKIHSDCVMLPPVNVSIDGNTILENGKFDI